jgi:chemotaxis protein methyltransferase CheR
MARTLNPGGYLLLGGSESLTGVSDLFEMQRHLGGVIYRLKS